MKRIILLALLTTGFVMSTQAQDKEKKKTLIELPQWVKDIKISGYGMLQYQGMDKDGGKENSFNLRLARISLDGKISDFAWKVQMQINGNTSTLGSSPRLVDLWAEWQKYDFFRVKAGQFSLTVQENRLPMVVISVYRFKATS